MLIYWEKWNWGSLNLQIIFSRNPLKFHASPHTTFVSKGEGKEVYKTFYLFNQFATSKCSQYSEENVRKSIVALFYFNNVCTNKLLMTIFYILIERLTENLAGQITQICFTDVCHWHTITHAPTNMFYRCFSLAYHDKGTHKHVLQVFLIGIPWQNHSATCFTGVSHWHTMT